MSGLRKKRRDSFLGLLYFGLTRTVLVYPLKCYFSRDDFLQLNSFYSYTVCPKLFGTPKMYQNGLQMSNYCAQLPPHTRLYIHGRPQIQKSPYGYTQGPKFIVFQNARIQTIFEDVKKTYFKFNQITMRPAYNGEELFFEQNK